jgi:hypothetical protein
MIGRILFLLFPILGVIAMIIRILFLLIPILGAIAIWYFYQDAL